MECLIIGRKMSAKYHELERCIFEHCKRKFALPYLIEGKLRANIWRFEFNPIVNKCDLGNLFAKK